MPAPVDRTEIVAKLEDVFRTHGYEGASLQKLSEATGLGRSSLYHHFPNGKEDMAAAVLARGVAALGESVGHALNSPGGPRERAQRVATLLHDFYGCGARSCLLEMFSMGEAGAHFRHEVSKALDGLMAAFTQLAEEAGLSKKEARRRGEDTLIAIQGALIVSRGRGDTAPFERVLKEFPDRLTGAD